MITCTKSFRIDAAHRVLEHSSKCAALHGHSYTIEVTCFSNYLDKLGMVVDFGIIKQLIGEWIEINLDHTTILHKDDPLITQLSDKQKELIFLKKQPYLMHCNPTAENLAKMIYYKAAELLVDSGGVTCRSVRVYETPTCRADYFAL